MTIGSPSWIGPVAGHGVGHRPVRPGGDDSPEGRAFGPQVNHRILDQMGHLALGHAGPDLRGHPGKRFVGNGDGLPQQGQFGLVLEPAVVLHDVAGGHQGRVGQARLEVFVIGVEQVVGLEAHPPCAQSAELLDQRRDHPPLAQHDLHALHLVPGLDVVAGVGDQLHPVGGNDQQPGAVQRRGVLAGEAAQVAAVVGVGHQEGVQVVGLHIAAQAGQALGQRGGAGARRGIQGHHRDRSLLGR